MIRLLLMAAAAATCFDVAPRSGRFDPATAKLVATLSGHGGAVTSIDMGPGGVRMISCSPSDAFLWDVRSRKKIREYDPVFHGQLVRLTPDGKRVIGVGRDRTSLRVIDAERGDEVASVTNVWGVFASPFAVSPDGKTVAVSSPDRSVRLCSVETGEEKSQPVPASARPTGSLSISPDGKFLGMVGWEGSVRVINIGDSREVLVLTTNQDRNGPVVFSPDSKSFLVAGPDRKIRRFDVATGKSTVEFPETAQVSRAVAFMPGGAGIVAGDMNGNLLFWDASTGKEFARIASQQGAIHSLAFTPDGRQLMTGGATGTIRIWGTQGVARKIGEKPRIGKPAYIGIRPAPAEAGVTGVTLGEIMADSAASKAGLQVGDVITHIGEKAVNTFEEMRGVLNGMMEGDEVEIFYRRGGGARTSTVKLGARPEP